jgi:hypothetical protein
MTTCELCLYRGQIIDHLHNMDSIRDWINCTHPVPWHQHMRAVPYIDLNGNIIEHNCTCYRESELCPKCKNVMEAVETFGCSLCGYNH